MAVACPPRTFLGTPEKPLHIRKFDEFCRLGLTGLDRLLYVQAHKSECRVWRIELLLSEFVSFSILNDNADSGGIQYITHELRYAQFSCTGVCSISPLSEGSCIARDEYCMQSPTRCGVSQHSVTRMHVLVAFRQVKSLKTPPKGVKLTMEVCCLMFDVKPVKVKDPDSGKKVRGTSNFG